MHYMKKTEIRMPVTAEDGNLANRRRTMILRNDVKRNHKEERRYSSSTDTLESAHYATSNCSVIISINRTYSRETEVIEWNSL